MAYRDEVEALAARHAALSAQLDSDKAEVDAAASLLAQARARAKLSVLDNIHIATPCSAEWSDMRGDDRVRACTACDKNVYNLSALTRAEAEALILAKEGRLCGRYYQRKDGTILLKDCMLAVDGRGRRRLATAGFVQHASVPAQHLTSTTDDVSQRPVHFTHVPVAENHPKRIRINGIDYQDALGGVALE